MRFEEILKKNELIKDDKFCKKLYASLCSQGWYDYIGDEIVSFTWRGAGGFLADVRNTLGYKEEYIDWYMSGNEGNVDPEIESFMNENGIVLFPEYYDFTSDVTDFDKVKHLKKTNPIVVSYHRDKKIDQII